VNHKRGRPKNRREIHALSALAEAALARLKWSMLVTLSTRRID